MTPAARYAAAIEVLDAMLGGSAAEPALLRWARTHRFAGSKDRAALRDIVFSIDRRRGSCAAMGGSMTGRGLLRGYLAQEGIDEGAIFGSGPYAPEVAPNDPQLTPWHELPQATRVDLQPWIWQRLQEDHGPNAAPIAEALRHRAPVWLRVNTIKTSTEEVLTLLAAEGFDPSPDPDLPTAIQVRHSSRKLAQGDVITEGYAEFQDLGPQRALALIDLPDGATVLDFCAGGGGKSLALAAKGGKITAHDADPRRMADLPARAARAGAEIDIKTNIGTARFDMVVCDVPCSGSGAFRRATNGKWQLTEADLDHFLVKQREIVATARAHLRPGGQLVYMTCSLFHAENEGQIPFLEESMKCTSQQTYTPQDGCDGFFVATFKQTS
ncbi:MAG: RsmB/NOP family class I SAM-dependent RNA methyltransferase [Pseudomonadota bacterium]